MIKSQKKIKSIVFSVFSIIFLFEILCVKCQNSQKRKFAPEDMVTLEELAVVRMKVAWNMTNAVYETGMANVTHEQMDKFSHDLITILADINEGIKVYERRIVLAQPDKLMNRIIDLQELDALKVLSDNPSDDPIINWKVKWIEVSSLATHIHWLYNKRIRDILTALPYIKTIATSIERYYGNPWHTVLSGNTEKHRRILMRNFPRMIDDLIFSVPQGDLFFGFRQLLNGSKTAKTGSAVKSGACTGVELTAKIFPVRLDIPLFVLLYLCLVDFKFYVLENYFQVYKEAFDAERSTNYSTSDDRLRTRIRRKIDAYNVAFKDYKPDNAEKKVMTGYYHCDPVSIDPNSDIRNHSAGETYIKFTNFLTVFVALEKTLSPTGKCGGSCTAFGKANDFCKTGDPKCLAKLHPECEKNPALCENYTPPCPIEHLNCFASGMNATVCGSENEDRLYDWIELEGKTYGPRKNGTACDHWTTDFVGTTEPDGGKPEKCEVCLCQCLEPIVIQGDSATARLFSMQEAVSRVADNRVVVGIKFEQVDDQLHFAIADAVSLPGFLADAATLVWLKPNASAPEKPEETKRLSKTLKTFHLDDIKAEEGSVVTGIKFIEKPKDVTPPDQEPQFYIGFSVQTTRVDHTTGDLDSSTSTWLTSSNIGINKTTKYSYVDPDDPVKADGPAVPDSAPDQYIEFRASSYKKDAGQTSIPFFDAQRMVVESNVTQALRGIGIFHRQKPGFGGFLGVKVLPYGEYSPF